MDISTLNGRIRIGLLIAAVLCVAAVSLPFWQVSLSFPQYPEGPLQVIAYADRMGGDIAEVNLLNQYIGVRFPDAIPELKIFPWVLRGLGALLVIAALAGARVGRWIGTVGAAGLLAMAAGGIWRMKHYLVEFGANPDPGAPLVGVKPFITPLWGTIKIYNVTAYSIFHWGTVALGAALALTVWAVFMGFRVIDGKAAAIQKPNAAAVTGPAVAMASVTRHPARNTTGKASPVSHHPTVPAGGKGRGD